MEDLKSEIKLDAISKIVFKVWNGKIFLYSIVRTSNFCKEMMSKMVNANW